MQPIQSPLDVVRSVRSSLTGLKILDIGCGTGGFVKALAREGANVSGIDPSPEAVQAARAAVPQAHFTEGGGEALPYADSTFDISVMVFSLHHVPPHQMKIALAEALRVITRDGIVIIMEPLASGSYFDALRPVEDETVVRRQAQEAIAEVIASGTLTHKHSFTFRRRESFADVQEFLDRVVSVDPARQAIIHRDREAIIANVLAVADRDDEGALELDLVVKVDVFGHP